MGGAGTTQRRARARPRRPTPAPSHYTHRSRHSVFSYLYVFMPCSCTILLIWIEFCWWWISFNTLTMSRSWAACVGGGRAARVRGVCVGVCALSPLGEDRCCGRAKLSTDPHQAWYSRRFRGFNWRTCPVEASMSRCHGVVRRAAACVR